MRTCCVSARAVRATFFKSRVSAVWSVIFKVNISPLAPVMVNECRSSESAMMPKATFTASVAVAVAAGVGVVVAPVLSALQLIGSSRLMSKKHEHRRKDMENSIGLMARLERGPAIHCGKFPQFSGVQHPYNRNRNSNFYRQGAKTPRKAKVRIKI